MRSETIGPATIHHGEALDFLQGLEPGTVDAFITDPPYSSGGAFRGDRVDTTQRKYLASASGNLAKTADFSGDNRDQRSFAYWSALWASAALRAAKPGAPALFFTDWRQLPTSTDYLQAGGWVWRGVVPWVKRSPRPQVGRFTSAAEYVVWGSAGPMPIERGVGCLPGFYEVPADGLGERMPSHWDHASPQDREHVTQKPVSLMADMCRIVEPGGLICDPFAGSGSTGVAAVQLGYRVLLCEADLHHFDMTCRRIERAVNAGALFAQAEPVQGVIEA